MGVLLDRRDVILGVIEPVQILEPIAQPLEESSRLRSPGMVLLRGGWKSFNWL